jgi:glycosyltransferase involved in cell wall biosynthesis
MKKKVFFYSSVSDVKLFTTQMFYKTDIDILRGLDFEVNVTNKIFDFLFFWKYDIAFIYFYKYGFFVSLISGFFGKKVYFTGGIDDLDEAYTTHRKYLIQKYFFKLCYFFSNSCILVSSTDKENVMKIFNGVLPKKIKTSFHAIQVENFLCHNIKDKGYDFSTIVWMGGKENVVRKGVDKSLELFKYLVENFPEYSNSKFIIIGRKGSGTDYLKEIIMHLDINEKVVFTGEVDENVKINILKMSKIYMQLSKYEGFGVAAAEALAAQNIVINSGKGGLKDSVGSFGIQVNIDEDIYKQFSTVHEKIIKVDDEFLKSGEQYIINNFSYDIRMNDFKKILLR